MSLPVALTRAALAALCLFAAVVPARAQVDYESGPTAIQFNFSNPGARSLAMAGALTGAGDDATGAWTNPAALTSITRPEIGVEFRAFDFATSFVSGGRFNGAASNRGIDTSSGLRINTSDTNTRSLAFLSVVVPRSRFAFSFYRTEVANFKMATSTDGVFFDDPAFGLSRVFPTTGELDLGIATIGGSAAMRVSDRLSVGVGLSVYDVNFSSASQHYFVFGPGTGAGDFLGPALRTGDNVSSTEVIESHDRVAGVNLGASFEASEKVRLGASYRRGPAFDMAFSRTTGFGDRITDDVSTFDVPDIVAVGALLKPASSLNVAVDFRRVLYSQIAHGMVTGFGGDASDYVLDDGNELRVAGEYLVTTLPSPISVLALRAGVWSDPDHRIRYDGPFAVDTVLYQRGTRTVHYTGGVGVVVERVQFDVGFDTSEHVKTFAASAVLRF